VDCTDEISTEAGKGRGSEPMREQYIAVGGATGGTQKKSCVCEVTRMGVQKSRK